MNFDNIVLDGGTQNTNPSGATNENAQASNGQQQPPVEDRPATSLNGDDKPDITSQNNSNNENGSKEDNGNGNGNNENGSSTGELTAGTQLDVDGTIYTVDASGNLVDDKGTIFKEAKDVKAWLDSVDVSEEEGDKGDLSITSLQQALGINVTDETGKPVEFTNDAAGVKSYVDSVINIKSNELQQAAINKLFSDNPMLQQFIDYVQLTGSPVGFGEMPDRTGITLDKNNVEGLKAVIKMAAREFNNSSLSDSYINWLETSGGLYEEADKQLKALQQKDVNLRQRIAEDAEKQRQAEAADVKAYWDRVSNTINKGTIGEYKLPESFIKEVDGKKLTYTKSDFYRYLSQPAFADENNNSITAYQADLNKLTDEQYLERELIGAWLLFTGGSYKDLVNMAINDEKVKQLKIVSKQQKAAKTVKVIKPKEGFNVNNIVL